MGLGRVAVVTLTPVWSPSIVLMLSYLACRREILGREEVTTVFFLHRLTCSSLGCTRGTSAGKTALFPDGQHEPAGRDSDGDGEIYRDGYLENGAVSLPFLTVCFLLNKVSAQKRK